MDSGAIIAIIIIVIALSVRSKAKKTVRKRPGATPQTLAPDTEETPEAEEGYPFPPIGVQEGGKRAKKEPRKETKPAPASLEKDVLKTEWTVQARISPDEMRKAVIISEILGKPVSMRDEN